MPISVNDQKNKIKNFLFNSKLIHNIFGNIFITAIIIVFINILIIYLNQSDDDNNGLIKLIIWMTISTSIVLIIHNKTIKISYEEQNKTKGTEEFKEMMENNTNEIIEKSGKNEIIEKDIIKFLD